jgi:hypothetical protein
VPQSVLLALAALLVVGAAALVSEWMAALVGAAALLAIIPLGFAFVVNAALRLVSRRRRGRALDPRGDTDPWDDHARSAQALLWVALGVGVPASYAGAYLNAASLFCF